MKFLILSLVVFSTTYLKGESESLKSELIIISKKDIKNIQIKEWESLDYDTTKLISQELAILDSIIQNCIDSNSKRKSESKVDTLGKYLIKDSLFVKQIVPFKNAEGDRVFYIMAMCESYYRKNEKGWKARGYGLVFF